MIPNVKRDPGRQRTVAMIYIPINTADPMILFSWIQFWKKC
jgi:hypothetical protein